MLINGQIFHTEIDPPLVSNGEDVYTPGCIGFVRWICMWFTIIVENEGSLCVYIYIYINYYMPKIKANS